LADVKFPTIDEKTYTDVFSSFNSKLLQGPLNSLINYSPPSDPSGTCPSLNIELTYLNGSVSTDTHCQLWSSISPLLFNVMTWVWAAVGVLIILSS
jgi:hypothetical protein